MFSQREFGVSLEVCQSRPGTLSPDGTRVTGADVFCRMAVGGNVFVLGLTSRDAVVVVVAGRVVILQTLALCFVAAVLTSVKSTSPDNLFTPSTFTAGVAAEVNSTVLPVIGRMASL